MSNKCDFTQLNFFPLSLFKGMRDMLIWCGFCVFAVGRSSFSYLVHHTATPTTPQTHKKTHTQKQTPTQTPTEAPQSFQDRRRASREKGVPHVPAPSGEVVKTAALGWCFLLPSLGLLLRSAAVSPYSFGVALISPQWETTPPRQEAAPPTKR